MNETIEKGGISVETEHIFPVIKRWLYSEKEIFLREIVSNACDAITKMKRLQSLGQLKDVDDKFRIDVVLDKDAKTITVSDNGIGMNSDEIRRYICQIALSGALDFIKKYEGENTSNGIIGHFGLGFYSAFMVSDKVEIISRSLDGSPTVRWICNELGEYEITSPEEERSRGTDIIMHINSDGEEYLSESRVRDILHKYCAFMPIEIYFKEAGKDEKKENKEEEEKPLNNTSPLWLKNPSDCTEEEYKNFYNEVFTDWREPLLHIHINADYPLNFKGILYFPKITNEYESLEGQVKLYYNQVFVADNIKEVIPEYLLMLRGVLDCPELPLNVSRSYLQNSGYVSKISAHIIKKVGDKLNSLFGAERENYEKLWRDIKLFVEYGCMRDRKFYDRIKDSVLFETTGGKYLTANEYAENAKGKNEGKIYYCTDKVTQAQYISMFEKEGIEVIVLDKTIDTQFISIIEQDKNVKFLRIDADLADSLKGEGEEYKNDKLAELFKKASGNDKLTIQFTTLKDESVPAVLNISEEQRRMSEMMKMYGAGMPSGIPEEATLVLNPANSLIKKLSETQDGEATESAVKQIYTLALLSQRQLTANELKSFLAESFSAIERGICS